MTEANAAREIAALFPHKVSASTLTFNHAPSRTLTERRAARHREFVLGRVCAQRALMGLGVFAAEVERQSDGAPTWPDGVVGSISHTDVLCAAIVARCETARSVGLDIERAGAAAPELRALILAPDEALPVALFGADNWLTAIFSAKEAFYKCHYALHREFLVFQDWRTVFDADGEGFGRFIIEPAIGARSSFSGTGFWRFDDSHIYTGFSAAVC